MALVERTIPDNLRDRSRRRRRVPRPVSASRGTRSLDSVNHLATSENFEEWRKRQETAQDRRRKNFRMWESLLESLKAVSHRRDYLYGREIRMRSATEPGSGWAQAEKRMDAARWSPQKDYERVSGCQSEWMGFRAKCCDGRAVAVPIGCNHRLCPLCNAHRAEHYRERVMALFQRIDNPQLLTLTVPNCKRLTRETISTLRKRLRAFLKDHKALLMGGVYSIEITRNRRDNTWHPHIHVLVDVAGPRERMPYWQFMERKWRLEFAWFVLTQGKRVGRRRWRNDDFEEWVAALDPRRGGHSDGRSGDRRSVDLRPVSSDKKAAYEVMKYMTKVAFFVDQPEALEEFLIAVKGVRAIQTFGSCYGFKLEEKPAEEKLTCECGKGEWEKIGLLGLGMVQMDIEGRWYVRDDAPVHGRLARCRGSSTRRGQHGA